MQYNASSAARPSGRCRLATARAMKYDAGVSHWLEALSAPVPPPSGLREWAATQPSYDEAWRTAPRVDWLVWLAAASARNDDERRDLVAGACTLAQPTGVHHRMFRLTPRPLERAYAWASARALHDIDTVVADWLHGILVAAVIVVPLGILMATRSQAPGASRVIGAPDLITIPLGIAVRVAAYVLFRRRRLAMLRTLPPLDFAAALAIALPALDTSTVDRPATDAQVFRARMQSVYARTRPPRP